MSSVPASDRVFPLAVLRLTATQWPMPSTASFSRAKGRNSRHGWNGHAACQMIGSLASGIAHNFNNLIGAILGYSEMVEPHLTPGTRPAQHIDEIRRAAERGRDLSTTSSHSGAA